MFFHPTTEVVDNRQPKKKILSTKDLKAKHDALGMKPIKCVTPILEEFKNSFGWLRNDIQQFLRTSDPVLQASISRNLEDVMQSDANKDATIEDVFDGIIPQTVQTPADIERFGRVLVDRYDGYKSRHTSVHDVVEKVDKVVSDDGSDVIQTSPEV